MQQQQQQNDWMSEPCSSSSSSSSSLVRLTFHIPAIKAAMAGERKLVRSKSGLRMVPTNLNNFRCPFELPEPPWIPDRQCARCSKCQVRFDFMKRRHHCRRCGNIFCSNCCDSYSPLPRMCFVDPVRLCSPCCDVTQRENDFYEKQIKLLTNGANFMIIDGNRQQQQEDDKEPFSFYCRLSSDHRFIIFDGGNIAKHEPLELSSIKTVEVLKVEDTQGNTSTNGLQMMFVDSQKQTNEIHFLAASIPNRKQSILWVTAIHKGIKMMFEAQNASCT